MRPQHDRNSILVGGDTVFAIGVLALGWFVLGLKTGWSLTSQADAVSLAVGEPAAPRRVPI